MATGPVQLLLFCSVVALSFAETNAQLFESPCPKLFTYEPQKNEKDTWHGTITLLSDSDLQGVRLNLIFDRPLIQLSNWFGEVITESINDYLIKNTKVTLPANSLYPLKFYVKYDPNQPPPQLIGVRLNSKIICSGATSIRTPASITGMLFTNNDAKRTMTSRLESSSANVFSSSVKGSTPSTSENAEEDDYFQGDIIPNSKPIGTEATPQCGTIATQPKDLRSDFPWHAAVYQAQGIEVNHICVGSLISKSHVITVAYCVTESNSQRALNPNSLLIYLGKYYSTEKSDTSVQVHHVSKIVPHPRYNSSTYANDIAIIELSEPAEFTDYVRPICLWEGSTDFNAIIGQLGTIVAWNVNEAGKLEHELVNTNMTLISKEDCIDSFPYFYSTFMTNKTFCADFIHGASECNGDVGVGLVFQKTTGNRNRKEFHLRGLLSIRVNSQKGLCDPQYYTVFTDVAKYLKFIKKSIAA